MLQDFRCSLLEIFRASAVVPLLGLLTQPLGGYIYIYIVEPEFPFVELMIQGLTNPFLSGVPGGFPT